MMTGRGLAGYELGAIAFFAVAARAANGQVILIDWDDLPVMAETIDQLQLDAITTVVLKIDVGEELGVLQRGATTLRQSNAFVVPFEAHPAVAARTRIDPRECLALLRSLGAEHRVAFCERSGEMMSNLSPDRPFFEQVRADDIYDVVAVRGAATINRKKSNELASEVSGSARTLWKIQNALEAAGVEFIPADELKGPGVRLRRPEGAKQTVRGRKG
jgi:hypothetical protein